jgi:hypothetical protein
VGERGGDVALEVVADEQHLLGRCPGGGEHEPVEERFRLPDAQRVGEQCRAEQAVDPCFLQGGPPGLAGQRVGLATSRAIPYSCSVRSAPAAAGSTGFSPSRWSIASRDRVPPLCDRSGCRRCLRVAVRPCVRETSRPLIGDVTSTIMI